MTWTPTFNYKPVQAFQPDSTITMAAPYVSIFGGNTANPTIAIEAAHSYLTTIAQELQDRIYEYVFEGEVLTIDFHYKTPPILRACKATYISAAPIMYKKASFYVERPMLLRSWLWSMRAEFAANVREIRVSWADINLKNEERNPDKPSKYAAFVVDEAEKKLARTRVEMPFGTGQYLKPGVFKAAFDVSDSETLWTGQLRHDFPTLVARAGFNG